MTEELRLTFRKYYRQHLSPRDSLNEIAAHYSKFFSGVRTTFEDVFIPISPIDTPAFEKKGILVSCNRDGRSCAVLSELRLVIPCEADVVPTILEEDFGTPVYAEFVKRFPLDREPQ